MKRTDRFPESRGDAGFGAAYRDLVARMKGLAESDDDVFVPNPEPSGPVHYVFVAMEPSLSGQSAEEVRADIGAGGRNFVNQIDVNILHFSIKKYLCSPGQRYHITDISKGGMLVKAAKRERSQRWDRWYPLLEEELHLVAKPDARFFAIGRLAEAYLKDRGWPVTYLLHYSGEAGVARNRCIQGYEKSFERFKSSVSLEDVLASATQLLTESVPPSYRDETLKRLARERLTESRKKLMFCYKLAFERQA